MSHVFGSVACKNKVFNGDFKHIGSGFWIKFFFFFFKNSSMKYDFSNMAPKMKYCFYKVSNACQEPVEETKIEKSHIRQVQKSWKQFSFICKIWMLAFGGATNEYLCWWGYCFYKVNKILSIIVSGRSFPKRLSKW